jgi:hypothetical protein
MSNSKMRKIIVTPTSGTGYLHILAEHISCQKDAFDEWHIVMSTRDPIDVISCRTLQSKFQYVKCIEVMDNGNNALLSMCVDPDTTYLKLSDDIVYMGSEFVRNMFTLSQDNEQFFPIFANIINDDNMYITNLHVCMGHFSCNECLSDNALALGTSAIQTALHEAFLSDIHSEASEASEASDDKCRSSHWQFSPWACSDDDKLSACAVAWKGRDMSICREAMQHEWPVHVSKKKVINGGAVAVRGRGVDELHLSKYSDIAFEASKLSRRRRIIVTPVSAVCILSILHDSLLRHKHAFDEWHLWLDSVDNVNVEALALATKFPWISCDNSCTGTGAGTAYLKLDADIVYMCPGFIDNMFKRRLNNSIPFLMYANAIEDGSTLVMSLHQRFLHSTKLNTSHLGNWALPDWTIQCCRQSSKPVVGRVIAWLGDSIDYIDPMSIDLGLRLDDPYLSKVWPNTGESRWLEMMIGDAICVHGSMADDAILGMKSSKLTRI